MKRPRFDQLNQWPTVAGLLTSAALIGLARLLQIEGDAHDIDYTEETP